MQKFNEEQPFTDTETEACLCGGGEAKSEKGLENGSSIGKFNSVDALLTAYNNLQAEFTRKCQRLKSLEKEFASISSAVNNSVNNKNNNLINEKDNNLIMQNDYLNQNAINQNAINQNDYDDIKSNNNNQIDKNNLTQIDNNQNQINQNDLTNKNDINAINDNNQIDNNQNEIDVLKESEQTSIMAEINGEEAHDKINKYDTVSNEKVPSYLKENFSEELANFLSVHKDAKQYAKEIGEEMINDSALTLQGAYDRVLAKKYKTPSELANDEEFLSKYIISNEKVLKSIIKQYKNNEQKLPTMITNNSGSIAQAYPSAVSTIKEAGDLAYKLFS